MMWKLLVMVVCLACDGLARPDVSHLLQKQNTSADKQKRQSFVGASVVSSNSNGVILTEIKTTNDAANGGTLIPQITLLPLEENQPSPFRRLEDRPGYDYQRPDFPLDVHPDSNLVSPVSTQAPEYLPPEGGEETSNVDKVVPPGVPSMTTTTPRSTTTATTTTTTTPAPTTYGSTQQVFDEGEGYGYKTPEVMLPLNINDVIGEASDINQLATTTVPTTTTTAPKDSLEYLPPKPLPELVVPKQPSTTTTTGQPQTTEPSTYPSTVSSTTYQYQFPTETTTGPNYPPRQPEVSLLPDASGSVSTVVTQQTQQTELPSTAAPEYLPPDATGFQIIVRIDADDNETSPTTVSSGSSSTTNTFVPSTEPPTTTLLPVLPDVDSLLLQVFERQPDSTQQDEQTTASSSPTTTSSFVSSSTTLLTGEPTGTTTPDETSSMISLINQLQEMNPVQAVLGQADFATEVRFFGEEDVTTVEASTPSPSTPTTAFSSTLTTATATEQQPTERSTGTERTTGTEAPTSTQLPLESRLGSSEETTGVSLIDLLTPTTTTTPNDTITTYRPSFVSQSAEQTTAVVESNAVAESSADESEVQPRIAVPTDDDDGYSYEAPENGLTVPSSIVPSSVAPSHTLEADGYHYKVPSVPFP